RPPHRGGRHLRPHLALHPAAGRRTGRAPERGGRAHGAVLREGHEGRIAGRPMGSQKRSALSRFKAGGRAWWETAISDVAPGSIVLRGHRVEDLIGSRSYAGIVGLLVANRELSEAQARLLEAALVAGVDHGVRAPSIAAARMAATCGIPLNCAVATGL